METPRSTVPAAASVTAQTQPNQAGAPMQEPPLEHMTAALENIINALRDTSAVAVNPRLSQGVIETLASRNLTLQSDARTLAERIDQYAASGVGGAALQEAVTVLGSNVQAYTQAVMDALDGIGDKVQLAGVRGTEPPKVQTPEEKTAAHNRRMWIAFGLGAVAVVAGAGMYAMKHGLSLDNKTKPRFKGVIPAR